MAPLSSAQRRFVPCLVSVAAILAVPIVFVSASAVSQPHWDWDTSFFGHYFALPLLGVALCGSIAAPLFAGVGIRWRLALSIVALVVFIGMVAVSYGICIILYGAPFH
jgi:hypothetical protein